MEDDFANHLNLSGEVNIPITFKHTNQKEVLIAFPGGEQFTGVMRPESDRKARVSKISEVVE